MIGNGQIYEKCGNKKEAMPLGGIDCPNKNISICLSLKKILSIKICNLRNILVIRVPFFALKVVDTILTHF
jgi:hypothetical protein